MKTLLCAVSLAALSAVALAAHATPPVATDSQVDTTAPVNETPEQRWQRLQSENARSRADRDAAQRQYEQGVRDAAAARQRYDAAQAQYQRDLAAQQQAVERADRARAAYDQQIQARQGHQSSTHATRSATNANVGAVRDDTPGTLTATAVAGGPVGSTQCQADQQAQQRARRRGRVIGSVLGSVAGVAGSQLRGVGALAALAVPVGALIGDQIARHLNCREQHQAALATEEATRGGVGTTSTWTSDTRPNVTGTSTVTAADSGQGDNQCLTVTDVIIVDGQETRAPKHMCRRPPSNRYVRV